MTGPDRPQGRWVDAILDASELLADAIAGGARLSALGTGRCAHDAGHVAVEFLHPVTTGKRAVPAWAGGRRAPSDEVVIAIGYGGEPPPPGAHIVLTDRIEPADRVDRVDPVDPAGGIEQIVVPLAAGDGLTAKRSAVLSYHVLWETVHLFLEEVGGRSSDDPVERLYPMLYPSPSPSPGRDGAGSREAARASIEAKFAESAACTAAAIEANRAAVERAAELVAGAGVVLTCGNGGSATDAADLAHLLAPRAWCLSGDMATVTALTNDVDFDAALARPVRILGRPGDALVALSTSGASSNVLAALAEARRGGLGTVLLAGYGGRAVAGVDVDVILAVESSSVHRIQEAQVALREAVVAAAGAG